MKGRHLALIACPVVAVLLYLPTLAHDFVFDDRAVIGLSPLLQDAGSLPRLLATPYWNTPRENRLLYRPLTSLTLAIDRAVAGGIRPLWFHLVNALLHGCATFLVTLLALEILPGLRAPAVAGLLFGLHPVHVEAVAGIVGRSEVLAACGAVGAVIGHRAALCSPGRRGILWMCVAWACCLVGVMAKESAVAAPALCLLQDLAFPGATPPSRRRRSALYAGYAAAVGLYLAARLAVLGTLGVGRPIPFVDNPAAAAGGIAGRLTALATVPRYAILLLFPARLSADYSFDQIPVVRSLADPWAVSGILLILAVVGGGAWILARYPACGFGLLWIATSAALTSNLLIFIGTIMAERLMYLPSAGLCLLFGWGVSEACRRGRGRAGVVVATIALAACASRSWARIPEWKDDFRLYRSAARVSPRSARIRYNLGNAYLRGGEYREAEGNYRAALAIYPEFGSARVNLGMALLKLGRPREARDLLADAVEREPGSAEVAVNLGAAHRALGDDRRAEAEFRRALSLDPGEAQAWNNLGSVYQARGDTARAIEHLQEAVRLRPQTAIFRINLADALFAGGRVLEGGEQFEAAHRLEPDLAESHRGLGEVALQRGDAVAAEREFRLAADAREPSARAANFLGYLLARRGDYEGAAEFYAEAVRLDPSLADAHRSLGLLYARELGEPARAARHLEMSLALDPRQAGADDLRKLLRELGR